MDYCSTWDFHTTPPCPATVEQVRQLMEKYKAGNAYENPRNITDVGEWGYNNGVWTLPITEGNLPEEARNYPKRKALGNGYTNKIMVERSDGRTFVGVWLAT